MIPNIVEQLRRDLMEISYDQIEEMVREAADEIERLRKDAKYGEKLIYESGLRLGEAHRDNAHLRQTVNDQAVAITAAEREIDRLLRTTDPKHIADDVNTLRNAEIERLREHVNALLLVATSHEPEALRLQAEIEWLRAAIAYMNDHADSPIIIRREARRALENKP